MTTNTPLSTHYTAYYHCGGCTDLATTDSLPELCPDDDCDAEFDHLMNWTTHETISSTELPPGLLGAELSKL